MYDLISNFYILFSLGSFGKTPSLLQVPKAEFPCYLGIVEELHLIQWSTKSHMQFCSGWMAFPLLYSTTCRVLSTRLYDFSPGAVYGIVNHTVGH